MTMTVTQPLLVRKVPGADFCATDKLYIIRSDIGLYLESSNSGIEGEERRLHPDCSGGDHYLSYWHSPFCGADYPYFFIIFGDRFRRVKNLSTAEDLTGYMELHEECRGGDHYLGTCTFHLCSVSPSFIIIFAKEGFYRVVSDLETAANCKKFDLSNKCQRGMFYWSTKSFWLGNVWHYRLVKREGEGIQFYYTTDLKTNSRGGSLYIPYGSTVSRFLGQPDEEESGRNRKQKSMLGAIWQKVKECRVMIQGWAIGLVVLFSAVFLFFGLQHLHQHWIDSESEMQTFYPSSGQGAGSVPKESYPVNLEGLINALIKDTGLHVVADDRRQMNEPAVKRTTADPKIKDATLTEEPVQVLFGQGKLTAEDFEHFPEPSIGELKSYLTPHVAVHWREIGQGLKIENGKLNAIEANNAGYPNQQERCLGNVFEKWYKENEVISWKSIVEVLLFQHLNYRRRVSILYSKLKKKHG